MKVIYESSTYYISNIRGHMPAQASVESRPHPKNIPTLYALSLEP